MHGKRSARQGGNHDQGADDDDGNDAPPADAGVAPFAKVVVACSRTLRFIVGTMISRQCWQIHSTSIPRASHAGDWHAAVTRQQAMPTAANALCLT